LGEHHPGRVTVAGSSPTVSTVIIVYKGEKPMKKLLFTGLIAAGLLAGGAAVDAAPGGVKGPAPKEYVCHYDAELDTFQLLYVAANSAHFDADKHAEDFVATAETDCNVVVEEV
jgi:hypothetical protein